MGTSLIFTAVVMAVVGTALHKEQRFFLFVRIVGALLQLLAILLCLFGLVAIAFGGLIFLATLLGGAFVAVVGTRLRSSMSTLKLFGKVLQVFAFVGMIMSISTAEY